MDGIDFWRMSDEFTIIQAALLICGIDPAGREYEIERKVKRPEGYDAIKHALITSYRNEKIKGTEIHSFDENTGDSHVNENDALLSVDSLKLWLKERGLREHFFFFPEELEGEYLDVTHPRYSQKLAAALKAWKALEDPKLIHGSVKQSVQKWLRLNATEFGLSDGDGKPIETAIEEISKIVNWQPKGGAPSTPTGKSAIKNERSKINLAITEENTSFFSKGSTIDDDEISF
jgi:hypothetical protein